MNPMDVGPYSVFPVKLGLQLGYWGASPPPDALEKVIDAEKLGFDAVFTAEAWGSDAFTPLAWYGSPTARGRPGTPHLPPPAPAPPAAALAPPAPRHPAS